MKEYKLMTDATCDLPASILEQMNIGVIPMEFEMAGEVYRHFPDGREMGFHEFYEKVREGEMPKTSQINRMTYFKYFEPILKEGKDILYIAFSSGLSGTYQASVLAAEELEEKYPERRVVCVDSRSASVGEGLLVYAAALQKNKGITVDALADWVVRNRGHVCHWFTVDDLNHLRRGGRISPVMAVAGSALGIKPVLRVDDEGNLVTAFKVRGRKKAMESILEQMEKTAINPKEQVVIIAHGDCKEDAKSLKQMVKSRFHVKDEIISYVGPIIGTHTGPGMLALVFFGTER